DHTRRLRVHRNATCHFQNAIFVEKWNRFEKEPGAAEWIRSLDEEFGRYFLQQTKEFLTETLTSDLSPDLREIMEQVLEVLKQQKA
ncbi:MAG TPA: hypothetical protein VHW24_07215, partial [Bryobacteraceae bacterium]|nr:hypothetical protein [Bryobacteraceae bacterium]